MKGNYSVINLYLMIVYGGKGGNLTCMIVYIHIYTL